MGQGASSRLDPPGVWDQAWRLATSLPPGPRSGASLRTFGPFLPSHSLPSPYQTTLTVSKSEGPKDPGF